MKIRLKLDAKEIIRYHQIEIRYNRQNFDINQTQIRYILVGNHINICKIRRPGQTGCVALTVLLALRISLPERRERQRAGNVFKLEQPSFSGPGGPHPSSHWVGHGPAVLAAATAAQDEGRSGPLRVLNASCRQSFLHLSGS